MIQQAIEKAVLGRNLDAQEAEAVMREIMAGAATEAQIAAFLTAMRMKGESVEELCAFARVMRENCMKVRINAANLVDTCGTGGDRIKTFNISTTAAFVASGAGVSVAKHGNRAVTSRSGSADVLEALGVNLAQAPEDAARCLEATGIAFLFAPVFHPAMKHAIKPRREIGIRTAFNVLGPLTNPFCAKAQLLGVYEPQLVEKMAGALLSLGTERGFVVHGVDGIDEASTIGKTLVAEIRDGGISQRTLSPEDFGLKKASAAQILGGDARENAITLLGILRGERGAKRDIVLANAALAIVAAGKADGISGAMDAAGQSIDSGRAHEKVRALVKQGKGDAARLEELENVP
jgi:anthranilate phosphoribosyltransferase